MPSHFSTIGLPVNSNEDITKFAEKASKQAKTIKCKKGHYLKWSSGNGAELWLQIDSNNNFVGLAPSFTGKSAFRVLITNEVSRSDDTYYEGAIHGWANPTDESEDSGDYPFIFDLIDKAKYKDLDFPFISEVTLSAFAHELSIYSSEDEYDEEQTEEPKFASESFIPSGLFTDENTPNVEPQPYAIFTGKVLEAEKLENPLSGSEFYWALVQTLGGEIDVLIDPELVHKPIIKGGVLSGSFWLNGKIQSPKNKDKKGLFNKLKSTVM